MSVLFRNARLLDPASGRDEIGALLVEDGRIAALGTSVGGNAAETVQCGGRILCPGLVDMRVFVGEPGAEHKETLASAGAAAAAGGVTTIVIMPNTEPVLDDIALIEYVERHGRVTCPVKVHPMAALTVGLAGERMAELGLLKSSGAVAFTEGDRALANAAVMRRALSYATVMDALICQLPVEPDLARDGVMNDGEVAMRLGLSGIPTQAETIIVERDLRLVELTGGRWHASLLSTAEAIEAVRRAKTRRLPVTAAAAPHHFALNENAVGHYKTFTKTTPPLRSESDRQAVVQGLKDGTIDIICSSHRPEDAESKRLPFEEAADGVVGLETLLPVSLELFHNGHLAMADLLACLTCRPADLLKLEAGRLAEGAPADLCIFDPDQPWRIAAEDFASKSKNTPFDERPVQGRVWRTVVDGRTVYQR